MKATDSTIIMVTRPDGGTSVMDAKTGRPLGVLPAGVVHEQSFDYDLRERFRHENRNDQRRQQMLCGLILGIAVVFGVLLGVLLTWI